MLEPPSAFREGCRATLAASIGAPSRCPIGARSAQPRSSLRQLEPGGRRAVRVQEGSLQQCWVQTSSISPHPVSKTQFAGHQVQAPLLSTSLCGAVLLPPASTCVCLQINGMGLRSLGAQPLSMLTAYDPAVRRRSASAPQASSHSGF